MTNNKPLEWFRVVMDHQSEIVCGDCLTKHKLMILSRVFGASQDCTICGKTNWKTEGRS